jgi:Ion channel
VTLQLLVGCIVSVINIMIHALITPTAIGIARWAALQSALRPVLMLAHTTEIVVRSLAYATGGAAPAGSDLLDFVFVNYTTLGYGDVTSLKEWWLIGPMTAMNGLMFGWSTAILFEALRKTVEHLVLFAPADGSVNSADPDWRVAGGPTARSGVDWGPGNRECLGRAGWRVRGKLFPASARDSPRYRGGTSAVR